MHTLNGISDIKGRLVRGLDYEMTCKGTDNMDICEAGQIVDMIKDLASAEKDCVEKCYYEEVIGAMREHGFEGEWEIETEGRMGYDNRRYANGQYAPKGHGHYSPVHGYTPSHTSHMGYPMNQTGRDKTVNTSRMGYPMVPDYMMDEPNHPFDKYNMAKRHYTESKDLNEKAKMDHFAKQHAEETVASFKEIWDDASPETKKDIKGKLSKLVAEMQV